MKVNIICSDMGWVYEKFISQLRIYSKHQILLNSKEKCNVTFYLPYFELSSPIHHPCAVWLSHQEQRKDLYDKFICAAKSADMGISHSKKYMDLLVSQGIKNVIQIVPGVDLQAFHVRSSVRPANSKLVVGYVGRQYTSSDRKNPKLLEKISKLLFVELKSTGGKIKEADMPEFYSSLDLIVSPAKTEGGPLCLLEGLATGTPIICFDGVGMANEFLHGVIRTPYADDEAFLERLKEFWDRKEHLTFRRPETMKLLREQVEGFTWESFTEKIDVVLERIMNKE